MIQILAALILAQAPAAAPRVTLSGYVQPQFEVRTTDRQTRDRALFRRMVFTVDAEPMEHWRGQFQVDAGPLASTGERPVMKNAFIQYTGWAERGLVLTIGNQKMPLARGLLMSSSRRGLIERTFTDDRAFGSPGRAPSIRLEGSHRDKHLYWMATIGESRQVPEADEIRVDGVAETGDKGNTGAIAGGRVELHPRGETPRDRGDLDHGPLRYTVGAATYGWWNDEDVTPHDGDAVDASDVHAFEVSGALRGGGWSLDAEYDRVVSNAVIGATTIGLYRKGRAQLGKGSLEAGYTVIPHRFEVLASFDVLDSDTFDTTWRRVAAGMNWYVKDHDLKFSLTHRESFDERGVRGARSHATFVQAQFVF